MKYFKWIILCLILFSSTCFAEIAERNLCYDSTTLKLLIVDTNNNIYEVTVSTNGVLTAIDTDEDHTP